MQALKDRRAESCRFSGSAGQTEKSSIEKNMKRQAINSYPAMMAGANELQKALASICIDTCRRRKKTRDMLQKHWDSFIS